MVNLCALNWLDSFIKKLKKTLDFINHMIYTPENAIVVLLYRNMLNKDYFSKVSSWKTLAEMFKLCQSQHSR